MLGTVAKAGRVIDLFTADAPEWGVSNVAERVGVPKSSAHALLSTLSEVGLLRRLPSGRYRLGWMVVSLNRALLDSTVFVAQNKDTLQGLADQLDAVIHIAALQGEEVIYLEKVVGRGAHGLTETVVGAKAPAHTTGLGKVLLANAESGRSLRIVERHGMARLTDKSTTSWAPFAAELSLVRKRGWAADVRETVSNICCVAAPIRDTEYNVQAALSISVPAARFRQHPEVLRRCVLSAAGHLTRPRVSVRQAQMRAATAAVESAAMEETA